MGKKQTELNRTEYIVDKIVKPLIILRKNGKSNQIINERNISTRTTEIEMIKMGYNVSLSPSPWVTMYHMPPSPITKKRWTNPRERWLTNHKPKMEVINM